MRQLRHRIRSIVKRVRSGEGAQVVADAAETAELWLTSESLPVPSPLRGPLEQLGTLLGTIARTYRPPPADVPPPERPNGEPGPKRSEPAVEVETKPGEAKAASKPKAKAKTKARTAGAKTGRAKEQRESGGERPRVSARRSASKKRSSGARPEPPDMEAAKRPKSNGKGRTRRPSARRGRDSKSEKPT